MKEFLSMDPHPIKLTFRDGALEEEYMLQKNELNQTCAAAIRAVIFTISIGGIINLGVIGNQKPIPILCMNLVAVVIAVLLSRCQPSHQDIIGACYNIVTSVLTLETFLHICSEIDEPPFTVTMVFTASFSHFISLSFSLSTYFLLQAMEVCTCFTYFFVRIFFMGSASIPLLGLVFFIMGVLKIAIFYITEKHQRNSFLLNTSRLKKQRIWKHIVDNVYPQSSFLVGKESEFLQQKSILEKKASFSKSLPPSNTIDPQLTSQSRNMIKKLNTFFFDGEKRKKEGKKKQGPEALKIWGGEHTQSFKGRKSVFVRDKLEAGDELLPAGKINAKLNVNSPQEMSEFLERFKIVSWELPQRKNFPLPIFSTAIEVINYIFDIDEASSKSLKEGCSLKEEEPADRFNTDPVNVKGYYTSGPSSERTYVNLKFTKFEWEKKPWILVFLEDTTAQEENKHLKQLDTMKDRLLASVTHDLRTPLNMVIVMLDNARSAQRRDELEVFLNFAEINAKLLSNLISDILDFSLIKENKMKLILAKSSLKQLIDEVFFLMRYQAEQKKIDLLLEFNVFDESIYSDGRRIKQILINLISNAIKFTKQGYVLLRIEEFPDYDCLKFEVSDTGNGILEDNISKLFQPFATFDNKEGSNKNGIGLGLSICKTLVTQLGPFDKLLLSTSVNKGSKFGFFLFKHVPDNGVGAATNTYKGMRPLKSTESEMKLNYNALLDEFKAISAHEAEPANGGARSGFERNSMLSSGKPSSFVNSPSRTERAAGNNKLSVEPKGSPSSHNTMNPQVCLINPQQCTFSELMLRSPREIEFGDGITNKSNAYKFNFLWKKNPFHQQELDISDISMSNIEEKRDLLPKKRKTLNILIVDDNPFNLFVLENYLKKVQAFQINILRADSGEQTLELFSQCNKEINKEKNIDVVFLDCEMPGISGYEASMIINSKIKDEGYASAYIVACTAHQGRDEELHCHQAGMEYFIVKPVSLEEIEAFLKSLYGI